MIKQIVKGTIKVNNPSEGTGIMYWVRFAKNMSGSIIPEILLNVLGGYPDNSDVAPSIVFTVLFALLGLLHVVVWGINTARGHYFHLSLGWAFCCVTKLIGFALRVVWAKDATLVDVGLTSSVLLIIPSILFASFDLILAQRLFTWRHPVDGSRRLFWGIMLLLYAIVTVLVAVTIAATFIPYLHLLSEAAYLRWKKVNMFTSIMVLLYLLTAMALIGLSYLYPPTAKDENLYTYQPWWIESFSSFYFVEPGAAQTAEQTFLKRNSNHRHAIRVIAATHHDYNTVEGLTNQRGDLKHNVSIALICATTVLILVGAIGRAVSLFENRIDRHASIVCDPVFMYIAWGAFEVIINVLYLVGRVDLRFYRPDKLPAQVGAIVTAEQSVCVSDAEEEDKQEAARMLASGSREDLVEKKVDSASDFHF
ncbi:hypothetical protein METBISCDRAFT_31042 [Metschnikowia bicuspidata]|uniref:Uncharacterized protein n=1 Tax=Metschnikowia bicuspidata TaxID=27322 RepID=A0A4P9ZBQ3_9ASCO|nr:hypothetical protein METBISCDRAFT_31042 [Metschnikowia bicuspidata]